VRRPYGGAALRSIRPSPCVHGPRRPGRGRMLGNRASCRRNSIPLQLVPGRPCLNYFESHLSIGTFGTYPSSQTQLPLALRCASGSLQGCSCGGELRKVGASNHEPAVRAMVQAQIIPRITDHATAIFRRVAISRAIFVSSIGTGGTVTGFVCSGDGDIG
jgi:hypothetical protein